MSYNTWRAAPLRWRSGSVSETDKMRPAQLLVDSNNLRTDRLIGTTSGLELEMTVFKTIFESSPDAIVITNREGRIVRPRTPHVRCRVRRERPLPVPDVSDQLVDEKGESGRGESFP